MAASNLPDLSALEKRIAELSPEKREYLERLRRDKQQQAANSLAIPRRKSSGAAPLSYAQLRMWILAQFTHDSPFYNETFSARLRFPLDVAALERAINEIIRRHELLRTGFRIENGTPVQVIVPALKLPLKPVDLRSVPQLQRESKAWELARLEALRPFDLNRDVPFMRTALLRLGENDYLFLLTMHHSICDGWAMGVFSSELSILYEAFSRRQPSPLPELQIQYADFAVWQRNLLAGTGLGSQLGYWVKQLSGVSTLELPTDRPRPPVQSFAGARHPIVIPPTVHAALKKLSVREDVTLFMTLLAAFQTLLHRYTGQDDIVVGVPVANRNRTELEALIGFFVNALVMRTDCSGNPTFRELLQRVRAVATGAFANQDVPFEKLVEELQPKRDMSRNPLFQVVFQLFNMVGPVEEGPANPMELDSVEIGTAKFDLRFDLYETNWDLSGHLEYCTDLFDAATIARMAGHYLTLLEAIVADADQRLSDLPMLTSTELQQVLVSWNDTDADYPRDTCVHTLVERQALRTPEASAVVSWDGRLSFAELNARANELAAYLQSRGVGPEVLVATCLERSLDLVVAVLGILKAGGAYLPMDPAYPAERLAYMLQDGNVAVLLTQERLAGSLPGTRVHRLCLDTEWNRVAAARGQPRPAVSPRSLAYVIYTSGSTGQPRGVEIEHRSLMNLVVWHQREYCPGLGDRATLLAGPAFDASVWELWPYLTAGAALCIPDEQTLAVPAKLWRWLAEERITHCFVPTPLAEAMLEEEVPERLRLRALLTGGDKLHKPPRDPLPFRFVNHYGPTENTVVTTFAEIAPDPQGSQAPPIGRPICNTRVYVLDRNLKPLPVGIPGELLTSGVGLARGYRNRPELTNERFIPDPLGEGDGRFYRTGDIVRYRPDGNLEFLGRSDHQVKLRGFRVELGEIESTLSRHPDIAECAVDIRPGSGDDKRLIAYLVLRRSASGDRLSEEQVAKWRTLYHETYNQPAPEEDPTFNIVGWNSSYTGLPMPAEQMAEQVDQTVARILDLRPSRVLEIGCGTGLLLFKIAPHCERYVGTDFSPEAIDYVRSHLDRAGCSHVELAQKMADDIDGFAPGSFDTVVLNSIIQYFPSVDYLMRVLESAAAVLEPGGRIFAGDVRNLNLLPAFHAGVELFQAAGSMPADELRERARRRSVQEQELAVDPAFFTAWLGSRRNGTAVEIQLKRGRSHNELVRYRYDVVLQMGGTRNSPIAPDRRIYWRDLGSLPALAEALKSERGDVVLLRGVPDLRVAAELEAWRLLESGSAPATCAALKRASGTRAADAVDPEAIWDFGRESGFTVRISHSETLGCFDAVFLRQGIYGPDEVVNWAGRPPAEQPWSAFGTNPLEQESRRSALRDVRAFLQKTLPDYMIPSVFVVLDALPLTPNGKVDRRALPAPDQGRPESAAPFVAPRTELEQSIAAIWQEFLGIEKVGVNDNFFDLGGHSLLIVRVHSRLVEEVAEGLSLTDLFQYPTVGSLARYLAQEAGETGPLAGVQARAAQRKAAMVRRQQIALDASSGGF